MQEEIRKIIHMNKVGEISEDEMIKMITQLKKDSSNDTILAIDKLGDTVSESLDEFTTGIENWAQEVSRGLKKVTNTTLSQNIPGKDSNSSTLSSVKINDYNGIYYNSFNLSKVADLQVDEHSCFEKNSINASSSKQLDLRDHSKVSECSMNASSVKSLQFCSSNWNEVSVNGSKVSDHQFTNHTNWNEVSINASKLSNNQFHSHIMSEIELNACKISDCHFENCEWDNIQFNKVNMSNVIFRNVKVSTLELSFKNISDMTFESTEALLKFLK